MDERCAPSWQAELWVVPPEEGGVPTDTRCHRYVNIPIDSTDAYERQQEQQEAEA